MAKLFQYKKQKTIFIILVLLFAVSAIYAAVTRRFENDWYNLDYSNYVAHPEEYTATKAVILDTKTRNGSSDDSLTILDFYQTAIVEVELADGRTKIFSTSRESSEKAGDTIGVCYDVRYDSGWDPEIEEGTDERFLTIPRDRPIENHFVSGIATIFAAVFSAAACTYAVACRKKND